MTEIQIGATISIGIAYWPGAMPEDWLEDKNGKKVTMNPCDVTFRATLARSGGALAVYRMRTDRMTVLR